MELIVLRVQDNPNQTKRLGLFMCPLREQRMNHPATELKIRLDGEEFVADESMLSLYNNHGSLIGDRINEWINRNNLSSSTKEDVLFEVTTSGNVDSFRLIGTEENIIDLFIEANNAKNGIKHEITRQLIGV